MTISIKSPTNTTGSIQKNGSDVITIDASDNVTVANGLTVSGNISTSGTIPAEQLTGDLPAISGANLTGLPAGYTDADALTLFNASGSAPVYACRAWVNYNGTGAVAIRASGNVSSITDNGVGIQTINYTTAMPNTNYAIVGMQQRDSGQGIVGIRGTNNSPLYTTASTRLFITNSGGVAVDCPIVCISVFR